MIDPAPTQVAQEFFESVVQGMWDAAASLADAKSLETWRNQQMAWFCVEAYALPHGRASRAGGTLTSVPTDEATIADLLRTHATTVLPGFPTRTTLADIARVPARDLFAMFLRLTAYIRSESSADQPHIVGDITENATTAFVLYRWNGAGWPKEPHDTSILRLQLSPQGWRYVINPGFGTPNFPHALRYMQTNGSAEW